MKPMKILMVFYPAMDPGGITNHVEQLSFGLRELGHELIPALIQPKPIASAGVRGEDRDTVGQLGKGLTYDQRYGHRWRAPYIHSALAVQTWRRYAAEFDCVIWEIPVPPVNRSWRGMKDWQALYDLPKRVRQLAITHDGNLAHGYPHIALITDRLSGVATTHPCSYAQASVLGIPRILLGTPQDTRDLPEVNGWSRRAPEWFSLQTFKRWKRVDDIIRAVPFTDCCGFLAGGGIEYFYMTSKEKTKPGYRYQSGKWKGQRIWDVALRTKKMRYIGWIDNAERDAYLRRCRVLIDSSYSHKYARSGDYFNRVSLEALRMGALPVVRTHGTIASEDGNGDFFRNGINCRIIPWSASPPTFASILNEIIDIKPKLADAMIAEGRNKLLPIFDRKNAAEALMSLLTDKPRGIAPGWADLRSKVDKELRKSGAELHQAHFVEGRNRGELDED